MRIPKSKRAFTMLELIFVIVILGVVASIGSQIIVQVYESYIVQRATHRTSMKTELAATQIANRLAYSIPKTIIARTDVNNYLPITSIGAANIPILEWVGFDADGFGVTAPLWSGYIDVDNPANAINTLSTPGSTLNGLNALIDNLNSTNAAGIGTNGTNAAIFFPDANADTIGFSRVGAIARDVTRAHPVAAVLGTTLTLDARAGIQRNTFEHYKLAWTAYALVRTPVTAAQLVTRGFAPGTVLFDYRLHYDYQPWDGENFNQGGGAAPLVLIRNVSVFRFTGTGQSIRFKLCQSEPIGGTATINTCKEKAVLR
jgi:prepilin-type N-terminal cleavage/methylation domain-containing protein